MKRFVDEFVVTDPDLMLDIVTALETNPVSGAKYEIEMRERVEVDLNRGKATGKQEFALRIWKIEPMEVA